MVVLLQIYKIKNLVMYSAPMLMKRCEKICKLKLNVHFICGGFLGSMLQINLKCFCIFFILLSSLCFVLTYYLQLLLPIKKIQIKKLYFEFESSATLKMYNMQSGFNSCWAKLFSIVRL